MGSLGALGSLAASAHVFGRARNEGALARAHLRRRFATGKPAASSDSLGASMARAMGGQSTRALRLSLCVCRRMKAGARC